MYLKGAFRADEGSLSTGGLHDDKVDLKLLRSSAVGFNKLETLRIIHKADHGVEI